MVEDQHPYGGYRRYGGGIVLVWRDIRFQSRVVDVPRFSACRIARYEPNDSAPALVGSGCWRILHRYGMLGTYHIVRVDVVMEKPY